MSIKKVKKTEGGDTKKKRKWYNVPNSGASEALGMSDRLDEALTQTSSGRAKSGRVKNKRRSGMAGALGQAQGRAQAQGKKKNC